jgi:hypothetical protein
MARSRNWNEEQNQNCFSAKRWRPNANHGREEICLEYLIRPFSQRWQGDLAGIAEQFPQSWMLPPMQQSGVALETLSEKASAWRHRIDTDKVRAHLPEGASRAAAHVGGRRSPKEY